MLFQKLNISIIGTGYVGLPTALGFSKLGHNVTCIDNNNIKIQELKNGIIPIYEKDINTLFFKEYKKITFTTSIKDGISNADIIIIAVGTPTNKKTNEADLSYLFNAVNEIKIYLNKRTKLIATKSTVPVKTGDEIEKIINNSNIDIISMPEFLREGFALEDFFNPDRIVIGANNKRYLYLIKKLYRKIKRPIIYTDRTSAELIKYTANAFLAIKINYINEIADLCENINANIDDVAKGIGADSRIGNKFLKAGIGYGGSCFPKDTQAMATFGNKYNVNLTLVKDAIINNKKRQKNIANKIYNIISQINEKQINVGILGLAFKNNTDDCRESPSINIIKSLLKHKNINIIAHDYKAINTAKQILNNKISYSNNIEDVINNADIICILTEWEEYKKIDFSLLYPRHKIIFDGKNLLDKNKLKGYQYYCIGKRG